MLGLRKLRILSFILISVVSAPIASAQIYAPTKSDFVEKVRFSTDGHPKGKGVSLVMHYPATWRAKETEYPNVVQIFTSENGSGLQSVQIIIRDLPIPTNMTRGEMESILYEDPAVFLPSSGQAIDFRRTDIDGEPAAILEYVAHTPRGDASFYTHTISTNIVHAGAIVQITLSAGNTADKREAVEESFNNYRPLFQQIMASIILPKKWN